MNRRLILTSLVALFAVAALSRCTSCWEDQDDPKIWVKKLKEAKSPAGRETALFNLYRIYEVKKALMEKDPKKKAELESFRKLVNPALVTVFGDKVNNAFVIPDQIIEKLVIFEADNDSAANLFVDIIKKYTAGDLDDITKDEDRQENLAAKAVDGLAKMALRKKLNPDALPALIALIEKVCVLRGGGDGKTAVEGLDPRSFVRNAVVKSMPSFLKGGTDRGQVAKILSKVVEFGQLEKSGQDPMVTIFAIIELGEVGDTSEDTVKALVLALLGKGRGRRFYSFAATSVAQLPLRGEQHPAVPPLLLMLKGDPWMKVITAKKAEIAELERKTPKPEARIKELQAELEPLDKKYKEKMSMPDCPFDKKYDYVCKELFWKANVEDWEKSEPGVIPMNALLVLREIGAQEAVKVMLEEYGIDVVQKRWLREALSTPMGEEKKDTSLPGVQMQKMVIEHYGSDMNIRSVLLRSLGRMNAAADNQEARDELKRSLTWSGDPTMLVKAGEGIYLNDFNEDLLNALIDQITKSASYMMVNFKKRQVKTFFWGKVVKGTCPEGEEFEEKFKECLNDPPKLPGEKEVKDSNWNCFEKFKEYWLPEFYYSIRYHKKGDYKRLVQPFCQKDDSWFTKTRVQHEEEFKKASSADREKLAAKLYACSDTPDPDLVKKGEIVKCGEWSECNAGNNFLCLDGHWQLRMQYYKHAVLLAPYKYVDVLMKITSDDIMKPHGLKEKDLPKKEGKEASVFYDADDERFLNSVPWPDEVEKLRLEKAKSILEEQLCQNREYLRVVKRCNQDVDCYVSVLRGAASIKLEAEDCENLKPPYTQNASKSEAPNWRHKLKALRMLAYLVQTADGGRRKDIAEKAVAAAIDYYEKAGRLQGDALEETREMVLLVIDRAGDYQAQKNTMCAYPYVERMRDQLAEKYSLNRYREELARAEKYKREEQITKYKKLIKQYEDKVEKELEESKKPQPCYKIFKLVLNDETQRSMKGVWQVNREARNTIGRLARRAKLRYDEI